MSHFCLLDDVENYVAHDWDLSAEADGPEHWLGLFQKHFAQTLGYAKDHYGPAASQNIVSASKQFTSKINELRVAPKSLPSGKLDIMALCQLRQDVLIANHLFDPFRQIKTRENDSAIALYPELIHKLHAMDADQKWLHLIQCVFAGNIFDLGSPATMKLSNDSPDFLATLERTKPRPWLVDNYDALAERLEQAPPTPWAKAVVFIDNCGTDFVLGVMPLVRELALSGTKIVLAANEHPALNDMTADETVDLVERLTAQDNDLAVLVEADMFEVVSTGNSLPLIDLSEVADELNEAAADADLVIIEGMGRAVESNFDAKFTVDCLWLALLKDLLVAQRIGGEVYDCVCKFVPQSQA